MKSIAEKIALTAEQIERINASWPAPKVNVGVDSAKGILADTKLKQPLPGR